MIVFFTIIILAYTLLILGFVYGFDRVPHFKYDVKPPKTSFSIIIPFKDEAKRLPALLNSISNLDYNIDLFEIICINDASIDTSESIIEAHFINSNINYKVLQNKRQSNSPKKDAITIAIKHAANDWIITTDADCILPKEWLKTYDAFIQKSNSKMILGPVTYKSSTSFLHNFQTLDFWSLQTVTIGGFGLKKPFLCNGANLAFTKVVFNTVQGYHGNNDIASGDDIFLMEKLLKHDPKAVNYLKSKQAIVTTYPESSWSKLFQQRLRWASKTSRYSSIFSKLVALVVMLTNACLMIMTLLCFLEIFSLHILGLFILLKIAIDYWAIYKSAKFYSTKIPLYAYLLCSLWYPIFSVLIASNTMFFKYKWKGRSFKT